MRLIKKNDPVEAFKEEVRRNVSRQGRDQKLRKLARDFNVDSLVKKYSYNFRWLGRPIIQHPQDIVAVQELIYDVKPNLVIETGIAHGGSLVLSASVLEMIGGSGRVIGIDIDIRKHNRRELEQHRMRKRITLIEGSSVDEKIYDLVKKMAKGKKVMVFLDSNHNHEHVLRELQMYSRLVSKGSYIVVFDTIAHYLPSGSIKNRSWNEKRNPKTALDEFLRKYNRNFVVDDAIESKILITAAPGGFLKRVK